MPARAFGRYHLLESLGAGGMGVVWRAHDPVLGRTVALKGMLGGGGSEVEAARFLREARLCARLRHPGIVAIYDLGEIDGKPYVTMEVVEGGTLGAWLAETRDAKVHRAPDRFARLSVEIERLAEAAEGVAHAHEHGIIHRDLKPGNILLAPGPHARVMDFGLARAVEAIDESRLTQSGDLLGTPTYMSPEQAAGEIGRFGPPTDVWALGAILYEILTGRVPFPGTSPWDVIRRILDEEPPPPSRDDPSVSVALDAVCRKAMEREPRRRYANAGAFAAELRCWLRGEPVLARPPSRAERARRWLIRRAGVAALAGVVIVGGAIAWVSVEAVHRRTERRIHVALEEARRHASDFFQAVKTLELSAEEVVQLSTQPLGALERILDERPDCGEARALRAQVLDRMGRRPEAEAEFDRACAGLAPSSMAFWLRGNHRAYRYRELRGIPSVTLDPTGATVSCQPPESPSEAALRHEAVADLERAERLDADGRARPSEDVAVARAWMAVLRLEPSGYREALVLLAPLASPEADFVRGFACLYLGRHHEARTAFARVLDVWPRDQEARLYRGVLANVLSRAESFAGRDPVPLLNQALADYDVSVAIAPDAATLDSRGLARLWRAEIRSACGEDPAADERGALEDFDASLQLRPSSASTLANRAELRHSRAQIRAAAGTDAEADYRAALEDLDAALTLQPNHLETRVTRAAVRITFGEDRMRRGLDGSELWAAAEGDLDEADRIRSGQWLVAHHRGWSRLLQAQAQSARGEDPRPLLGRAIADFDEALRRNPRGRDVYVRRADARIRLAHAASACGEGAGETLAGARADLDAALALTPNDGFALRMRALVGLYEGRATLATGRDPRPQWDAARLDLDECLRLSPRDGEALRYRGLIGSERAALEVEVGVDARATLHRAVDDLARAAELAPGSAEGRQLLGAARVAQAQAEGKRGTDCRPMLRAALEDFDAAARLDGGSAESLHARGDGWNALAQAEQGAGGDPHASLRAAIADFDAALAREPGRTNSLNNRANAWRDLGAALAACGEDAAAAFARAEADYLEVIRLGTRVAWLNLGLLYRDLGRFEDAIRAFEAGARGAPSYVEWAAKRIEETRAKQAGSGAGGGTK